MKFLMAGIVPEKEWRKSISMYSMDIHLYERAYL